VRFDFASLQARGRDSELLFRCTPADKLSRNRLTRLGASPAVGRVDESCTHGVDDGLRRLSSSAGGASNLSGLGANQKLGCVEARRCVGFTEL